MIWIYAVLLMGMVVSPASAQNPADLSFTLASKQNRTTFRMGEPIDLEFRFASSTPGRYEVHELQTRRRNRFFSDPADGSVDPFRDFPGVGDGPGGSGPPPRVWPLEQAPVVMLRQLNAWWLSFRKPGRYRLTAETDIVTLAGQGRSQDLKDPIRLRSTSIEIEIVQPERGWIEDQIRVAVAAVDQWQPDPPCSSRVQPGGIPSPPCDHQLTIAATQAAHALSLLETRESALAIVRLYRRPLPAEIGTWLEYGLRRSPFRADVIAAMQRDLEAPDISITAFWIGTLIALDAVASSPGRPDFARSYNYYYDRLAAISEHKMGPAREVSLTTLATRYR